MLRKSVTRLFVVGLILILLAGSTAPGFQLNKTTPVDAAEEAFNYLPIMLKVNPWRNSFGVEITSLITSEDQVLDRATHLPTQWVRLNTRISWRQLQPNEGDPIGWDLLIPFENELRALQARHITPIVVVNDYPAWATATRLNGDPSYCGPLLSNKFSAFADFVSQLAERYEVNEFNVHIWELGNEPDIDGNVYDLPLDSQYGCWGDATDLEFYGGQLYGEMLQIVAPAIKAADPLAQVWVGGLLLNSPLTDKPGEGRPELFLQGILEAGIGTDYTYFDVVPYHAITSYTGEAIDYDNGDVSSSWYGDTWGGMIQGKAKYLRDLMAPYGVEKPLFVNEISLTCTEEFFPALCNPPVEAFWQMQADHLVRTQVRGLSTGIMGYIWYALNDPGWRNSGLLTNTNEPHPSYLAYQQLATRLINADYLAPVDYGTGIEAYAFSRGDQNIHIVWTEQDVSGLTISIPASNYIEAHARDGASIPPVLVDGNYQVPVGFSPIYVILKP